MQRELQQAYARRTRSPDGRPRPWTENPAEALQPDTHLQLQASFGSDEVITLALTLAQAADLKAVKVSALGERLVWKRRAAHVPDFAIALSNHCRWDAASRVADPPSGHRASVQARLSRQRDRLQAGGQRGAADAEVRVHRLPRRALSVPQDHRRARQRRRGIPDDGQRRIERRHLLRQGAAAERLHRIRGRARDPARLVSVLHGHQRKALSVHGRRLDHRLRVPAQPRGDGRDDRRHAVQGLPLVAPGPAAVEHGSADHHAARCPVGPERRLRIQSVRQGRARLPGAEGPAGRRRRSGRRTAAGPRCASRAARRCVR